MSIRPTQSYFPFTLFTLSLSLCLLLPPNVLAKSKEDILSIGKVQRINGEALILRGDKSLPAKSGEAIQNGDVLETHKNTTLGVVFTDNSSLILGKDSKFLINHVEIIEGDSRTANFNFLKGTFKLKMTQMPGVPDEVEVQIPNGGSIKVIAAEVFGGYLEKEYFDVALLGTGQIIIKRDSLQSVIKIPGFGASFENKGSESVKPKRLTPEKIKLMQSLTGFD